MPCQDSPSIKTTYTANVSVPKPLTAVMSAICKGQVESGANRVFIFEQSVCIPTYLIALAVGNVEKKKVSERCDIWTEPEMLQAAGKEFEDTEVFLTKAEEMVLFI